MSAGLRLLRSAVLLGASFRFSVPSSIAQDSLWVGTWAASPTGVRNSADGTGVGGPQGTTLREIVHVSMGGSTARVIFTNEFGTDQLTIGPAQIARRGDGVSILQTGAASLTFSGRSSITIPPGALAVSDPAHFDLAPLSDVAVTFFVPSQPIPSITRHGGAGQSNFFVAGNTVGQADMTAPKGSTSWDFLKGIDVQGSHHAAAVVAFGDSITDGARSTQNGNARWPDVLSRRLAGDKKTVQTGVLNEGIGGNRLLHDISGPSALARFDRDVLAQADVHYVVILEGINDIGHATDPERAYDVVSAADLIAGLTQLAERAHTRGLKVYGATLTPYQGAKYFSPAGEAERQALNQWIRTTPKFDAVIDFDKVIRDPANPAAYLPAYDSGDHLHPSDAGYKAMGESIDLKLFER